MNERIKELWEESQQWNGSDDGRGGLKILESVEKFAELIVRECIDVVEDAGGIDKYHYTGAIGKHFGVEQ